MRITNWCLLGIALVFGSALALPAQPVVPILNTFNNDTLGAAPGPPEVGSAAYLGSGTFTVINGGTSQSLQGVDSSAADAFAVQWASSLVPVPEVFEVSYLVRVDSASALSDISAQELLATTSLTSEKISLQWLAGGVLRVGATVLPASWLMGTTYLVRLKINCATDTYSIWIDGAVQVNDQATGFDCLGLHSFVVATSFDAVTTQTFDEVKLWAGDLIFPDGFESGDRAAWSSAVPP